MRKTLAVLFTLILVPHAFAADTLPRTRSVPSLGWSLDQVLDLTSAGTVSGVEIAATDLDCTLFASGGKITTNSSGHFLCADDQAAGGAAHNLLSATHSDTAAAAVSRGSIVVGNSTPAWSELTVGAANSVVVADGTDTTFSTTPTIASITATGTVSGAIVDISTADIVFSALDCSGLANGGALTTDSNGWVRCSDDESGGGSGGAPTDADYLVGTANGSLSAEIVVGTSPGGELGGTWGSPTIDDSLAVTSWNLTTPTITTSLTTSTPTTLSVAELDRLDGLAGTIVTDTTAATEIDGTGLTITASTLNCDTSDLTTVGCIEVATAAETTTGTDATRAVSPDGLAGSDFGKRVVSVVVLAPDTPATTGDGQAYIPIDATLNGMNLVDVDAYVQTVGTTGTIDIDLARCAAVATGSACTGTVSDMLSVNLTIDSNEDDDSTAATGKTIDTTLDDVATGQSVRIDVDAVHTTPSRGLVVILTFQLP